MEHLSSNQIIGFEIDITISTSTVVEKRIHIPWFLDLRFGLYSPKHYENKRHTIEKPYKIAKNAKQILENSKFFLHFLLQFYRAFQRYIDIDNSLEEGQREVVCWRFVCREVCSQHSLNPQRILHRHYWHFVAISHPGIKKRLFKS